MKRFTIPVVLLGVFVVSLLLARPAPAEQQGEQKAGEPAKLEQLQNERIETFEKLVKIVTKQYKIGTVSFIEFSKAQEELVKAKLDAAKTPRERIALLEEQLKIARGLFDFVENQRKGGPGTEADSLRAKAHCLTNEIRLAKERGKEKPAG